MSDEPPLFIGYLAAEGSGDESCLHHAACESPNRTTEYLKASKAILKGAEMFEINQKNMAHYYDVIVRTERAVIDGLSGVPCDAAYPCRL